MKLALQLYSIRAACREDLQDALRRTAAMGFSGVEFAGFFGCPARQVAGWLKQYGLEAMGAHIPAEEILERPQETIAYQQELGNRRIVCPGFPLRSRSGARDFAESLQKVDGLYEKSGMQLFYHNHQQEFAVDEGERLLDTLAGAMPGLALELDVYWAYRGGADPLAYLEQRRDQVRLLHLKDGTMEHGTEAGRGNLPLAELAACGNRLGIPWAVVETEQSETAAEQLEDARRDLAFLSGLV